MSSSSSSSGRSAEVERLEELLEGDGMLRIDGVHGNWEVGVLGGVEDFLKWDGMLLFFFLLSVCSEEN